jgi:hypothetical protein
VDGKTLRRTASDGETKVEALGNYLHPLKSTKRATGADRNPPSLGPVCKQLKKLCRELQNPLRHLSRRPPRRQHKIGIARGEVVHWEEDLFFSRASDEWIPKNWKNMLVMLHLTIRMSRYNIIIMVVLCWKNIRCHRLQICSNIIQWPPLHIPVLRRPFIHSADRPLNTGSKSDHQDFPDKRLIKLFIPDCLHWEDDRETTKIQ